MVLAKDSVTDKSEQDYKNQFNANDKSGTVARVMKRSKRALANDRKINKQVKDDLNFAFGDQWTQEDKDTLNKEGRPCLTFNKIEPLLDLVGGWERENSFRIRVFPEGKEDRIFSDIGDKALSAIDKWGKLNYKLDHLFDEGVAGGKSWLEMAVSYDDDIINGDLVFRNDGPFAVLVDPDSVEYDHSDAEWQIKMKKYTKSKLKRMYPKKKTIIDGIQEDVVAFLGEVAKEGDRDNYHLGQDDLAIDDVIAPDGIIEDEDDKIYLFEEWYKKYEEQFFVYDYREHNLNQFDKMEEAEAKRDELMAEAKAEYEQAVQGHAVALQMHAETGGVNPENGQPVPAPLPPEDDPPEIRVIKRDVPKMYYCAVSGGQVMQEEARSPMAPSYEGFVLFNFYAKFNPSAPNVEHRIKGIVRNAKDPQKEINKSRSQFLHIVNTSANSGWIGDDDALKDQGWQDLETMGSAPGVVVKKKPGSHLERIQPAGTNMANLLRGDKAEEDLKGVTGINPDALATQDKTTSGKAIALRIRQAITILVKVFRNFRYTKEIVGSAVFAMIPEVFNAAELRKVLGEDFMETNQIDDGYLKAFLAQIKDGKFDLKITEADNNATVRGETFENLMEMSKSGYPIPPDLIIEFSSIPNAAEVTRRIKEYAQEQQAQQAAQPKK